MRIHLRKLVIVILGLCCISFVSITILDLPLRWKLYDPTHHKKQFSFTVSSHLFQEYVPENYSNHLTIHWSSSSVNETIQVSYNVTPSFVVRHNVLTGIRHSNSSILWPDPLNPWADRILEQLYYVPKHYQKNTKNLKKILVAISSGDPRGRKYFLNQKCPVDTCELTMNLAEAADADAIVLGVDMIRQFIQRPGQVRILYLLESPSNTGDLTYFHDSINWTATYRSDSTLTTPYEKFVYFPNVTGLPKAPLKNYAAGKTKMVAWFVSNCETKNNRLEYAKLLDRYITVDIYGACGNYSCSRHRTEQCKKMLRTDYKFYLAFENSNCQHYVTEKFFQNAMWNDIVPVVMGARKEDYLAIAPPESFIFAGDFPTPRHLAEYLHKLDRDDELYNSYFRWKGMGRFINTKFWCRVCALLHADNGPVDRHYADIGAWWRQHDTCTKHSWTNPEDFIVWD